MFEKHYRPILIPIFIIPIFLLNCELYDPVADKIIWKAIIPNIHRSSNFVKISRMIVTRLYEDGVL